AISAFFFTINLIAMAVQNKPVTGSVIPMSMFCSRAAFFSMERMREPLLYSPIDVLPSEIANVLLSMSLTVVIQFFMGMDLVDRLILILDFGHFTKYSIMLSS